MAERRVGVLVVGGGAAADACAVALREGGYADPVLICTREAEPPYDRPPCSKGYLRGDVERAALALRPASAYADAGIELALRTSVMRLDPAARVARLSTREEVRYEHVVLTTGANVRRLRADGAQLDGLHYLRAPGNADAIRADVEAAAATDGARVVLVGGSYIACEVAASLTAVGHACTLVMTEDRPLSTHFGAAAGRFFGALLTAQGVTWHGNETVVGFAGGERVQEVVCRSGRRLAADLVVLGTGAVPDVVLARAAGLGLGLTGGVACDARLAAGGADAVWCAGDACEYDSVLHGGPARIEHWEVARGQGGHVARAILGDERPYAQLPYFWSELADWCTLEAVGPLGAWDSADAEQADDGLFVRFTRAGRLVGALAAGAAAQASFRAARSELTPGPSS